MKGHFSQLEARIEALVEGTFARLFAGHIHPRDVAIQLVRALEDSATAGAPATAYAVRLHPADAQALQSTHPQLADLLSAELLNGAREAHIMLPEKPDVAIVPDLAQKPRTVVITTEFSSAEVAGTQSMTPVQPAAAVAPRRAFLILNGERTVPLTQPLVTLGRRFDNQIVLDDRRVSRAHAQLRLRFGRYVIYDMASSSGTFVNGQSVETCVLRPGDVISLGGVLLIYGEEDGPDHVAPRTDQEPGATRPGGALGGHRSTRPLSPAPPLPDDTRKP